MTGYSDAEAIGQNPRVLKSGKHGDAFYRQMWSTIISGAVWRGEVINRRKDASLYVEEMTITPVRSTAGNITHFVAVKEDITARKQAEETLHRQASLIDLTPDAVIALRMDGTVTSWNRGAEVLYGWSKEEAIGRRAHALYQTKFPKDLKHIEEELRRTGRWSGELTQRKKDGHEMIALSRWRALFDAHGEVSEILESNTDISERKLTELALIRSEKLASVGRMAATVAHELNNPLTSAISALYLLRKDPALPHAARQYLAVAEQELSRVAHISKQSLGFYREVGNPTLVNLAEVLDSVLEIYAPRLRNKNISLTRRYRSATVVQAIEGEIRQVASNIIANSIDALPQWGELHVRITGPQLLSGQRRMVRMTIADNGEGISSKNLKRIGEPFFTTKKSVGTGLGLWVTSELVKKHDGKLQIKSRVGRGDSRDHLAANRAAAGGTQITMSTDETARTILVVDDEHVLADMLAMILEQSGYKSTAVYSAAEALAALKIHPDLIISDVMMPEVDGVELAVQVAKMLPGIKILLISGHAGTQELLKASGLSLDFLAKPFSPEELLARVAAALDGNGGV